MKRRILPGPVISLLEFLERRDKGLRGEPPAVMPKITSLVRQLLNVIPPPGNENNPEFVIISYKTQVIGDRK